MLRTVLVNASAERLFPVRLMGKNGSAWLADVDGRIQSRQDVIRRGRTDGMAGGLSEADATQHGGESIVWPTL